VLVPLGAGMQNVEGGGDVPAVERLVGGLQRAQI